MRILYVTKFVPEPPTSGGRMRSLAVLGELCSRGRVTLACFDDGTSDSAPLRERGVDVQTVRWPLSAPRQAAGVVRERSVSTGRFSSTGLRTRIAELTRTIGPWDLVQVEYLQMAPYGVGVPAARRVLDLHNVESDLTAGLAATSTGPMRLLLHAEAVALRRLELRMAPAYDGVAVVSQRDRTLLPGSWRQVSVCPNGLDLPEPDPTPPQPRTVTFTATLGWQPNVDAALWLVERVWPQVLAQVPDARLALVGRDPSEAVRRLVGPSVTVTGTVPDVLPHVRAAAVSVAPLLAGGGSRLKILEALGAERPVVSTTVGASGLEELHGAGLAIADSPEDFAGTLVRLLLDPAAATALGAQGRAAVGAYAWGRSLRGLHDLWGPEQAEGAA